MLTAGTRKLYFLDSGKILWYVHIRSFVITPSVNLFLPYILLRKVIVCEINEFSRFVWKLKLFWINEFSFTFVIYANQHTLMLYNKITLQTGKYKSQCVLSFKSFFSFPTLRRFSCSLTDPHCKVHHCRNRNTWDHHNMGHLKGLRICTPVCDAKPQDSQDLIGSLVVCWHDSPFNTAIMSYKSDWAVSVQVIVYMKVCF